MRTQLPAPDKLFQTKSGVTPAVLWGVPFCEAFFGLEMNGWETAARKMIYTLNRLSRLEGTTQNTSEISLSATKIRKLLDTALAPKMAVPGAFYVLAVARSLPALSGILTEAERYAWWRELESVASDAVAISTEKEPLAALLMAGELAETLAYVAEIVFNNQSEVKITQKELVTLKKQAKKVLSETLDTLLDGAGAPDAGNLPIFRMLVAAWTRMRWLDATLEEHGKPKNTQDEHSIFDVDSLSAYEWAVRMLLYFTRPDGSLVFSSRANKSAFWCPELFVAALKMDSDRDDKQLAIATLPDMKAPEEGEKMPKLPECSSHSPWGRVAVLQKSWTSRSGVTVTWNEMFPKLEVMNRKVPIFSGDWAFSGTWKGKALTSAGRWRSVLWHSVEQGDYLELELPLSQGFTLQRQFFLAREENFLILSETLSGDGFSGKKIQRGELSWRSTLPMAGGVKSKQADEALEITVSCRNGVAGSVLPLALPEWRKKLPAGNDFRTNNMEITAEYCVDASALYAPIFLDMNPQRCRSALTWRRLAVGEKLQNVSPAVASGFRVQIDDQQWVLYRSLSHCCNRSVMGVNLNSESYIGIFNPTGNCTAILDVETPSLNE